MSELENVNRNMVRDTGVLVDPTWKDVYLIAGLCLIGIALLAIGSAVLNIIVGAMPSDSITFFNSLAGNPTLSYGTYGLLFISDFLWLPATLALYLSLKHINKNWMLIWAAICFMYILISMANMFNGLTLVSLAQHYTAATTDALRTGYAAAADYPLATIPLFFISMWIMGGLGYLIVGLVMLKGVFGKIAAYLGIITGIVSLIVGFSIFIPVLAWLSLLTFITIPIWDILVGYKLYNLSRADKQSVKNSMETTA